jgi:hypothetical protein
MVRFFLIDSLRELEETVQLNYARDRPIPYPRANYRVQDTRISRAQAAIRRGTINVKEFLNHLSRLAANTENAFYENRNPCTLS